jgi:hypothetical protein
MTLTLAVGDGEGHRVGDPAGGVHEGDVMDAGDGRQPVAPRHDTGLDQLPAEEGFEVLATADLRAARTVLDKIT